METYNHPEGYENAISVAVGDSFCMAFPSSGKAIVLVLNLDPGLEVRAGLQDAVDLATAFRGSLKNRHVVDGHCNVP